MAQEPFPAPKGYRWLFVTQFTHWRSKRIIHAIDYGRKAFCFLVRLRKNGGAA